MGRENEYLRLIWSYIFEILFPPKGNVHVITGEAENTYTTDRKKEQYPGVKSIRGFKIDIRLVVEVEQEDEEIDVAVGECAKIFDDKAINNGKLLRKCKDSMDSIIYILKNDSGKIMSYMIQITGSSCALSAMHLVANGLYITQHRHSFNTPSSFDYHKNLPESSSYLITMKNKLQACSR